MQRFSLLVLLLGLLALGSCGGTNHAPSNAQPQQHRGTVPLSQLLAELDSLQAPADSNAAQFAELKQSLRSYLLNSGETKFTAAAPTGSSNAVNDLTPDLLFDENGVEENRISWSYRNIGDYDQNSEVNVADLSALGAQLGKTTTSPDWETRGKYADGDNNGEVNISDISPLGAHLLSQVTTYRVESGDTAEGPWTTVTTVNFGDSALQPSGIRMFIVPLDSHVEPFYRVIPVDGSGTDGVPSLASTSFILSDKAELVGKPDGVQYVSRDGNTIVLLAPDTNPTSIAVGDILVGNDEDGYLWRVLTVEQTGDQITVTGENAAITDLIIKGVVDLSGLFAPVLTPSSVTSGAKVTSGPHELVIDCPHTDLVLGSFDVSLNALHFKFDPDLQLLLSVNGKADPDNPVQGFVTKLNTPLLEYWVDCALENAVFNGRFPADPDDPAYRTQVATIPFEFDAEVNGVPMQAKWSFNLYFGMAGNGDFNGTYQFDANANYSDALFGGWWSPLLGWSDYNQFTSSYSDPDGATAPAVTSTATAPSQLRYYLYGILSAGLFDDTTRKTELEFQPTVELGLTPTTTPSDGDLYVINGWLDLGRNFALGTYGTQVLEHSTPFSESPQLIDSGFIARTAGGDKSISGRVTDGVNGIPDVYVVGEITGQPGSLWGDLTDANGDYTLTGISPGLNVTVIPDPGDETPYEFMPDHYDYPNVVTDITGADFVASAVTTWQHTLGFDIDVNEGVRGIASDAAGNTYICGHAPEQSTGDWSALVAKYSPSGDLLWSKLEGVGFTGSATFNAIAVNATGVYTVGDFDNENTGNHEMLVMRWDHDGNLIWKNSWGLGTTSAANTCALDTSGNLYVGGVCTNVVTGLDPAVIKYASIGAILWQKTYQVVGNDTIRGSYYDAGNFYLTGRAVSSAPTPSDDVVLLKIFNDGSVAGDNLYDIGNLDNSGLSVITDGSFNTYLAGATFADVGDTSDSLLIKLSPTLTPVKGIGWHVTEAGGTYNQTESLCRDGFGNLFASGYWDDSVMLHASLASFDEDLTFQGLAQILNGNDETRIYSSAINLADGDLLLGGYAPNASLTWENAGSFSQTATVTQLPYGGVLLDAIGTVNPPAPFTSDIAPVEDTGNGQRDALTIKRVKP